MVATMTREQMLRIAQEDARARLARRARTALRFAREHARSLSILSAVIAFALIALVPAPAFAGILGDMLDDAVSMLLAPMAEGIFNLGFSFIHAITPDAALMGAWDTMFADNTSFVTITEAVADNVVEPCAKTVLAIVILMQLFKIASEMDRNGGTLPGLREVVKLFVFCAVSWYVVDNAYDIMLGVFELIRLIIDSMNDYLGLSSGASGSVKITDAEGAGAANLAILIIVGLVFLLIALFAAILANAMALARTIELYLFSMFAPLPLALFGFDETKGWAIGFVKNFIAVCLSGAIMLVLLWFFPTAVNAVIGDMTDSLEIVATQDFGSLVWPIKLIATSIVLCIMLLQSGSLAQRILGGA